MIVLLNIIVKLLVMIKQFRLDRFNGVEFLVLELYSGHTWTKFEVDAFSRFMEEDPSHASRSDFRILLDEWLSSDHPDGESFYGLTEPIPVIEYLPCIVVRGAIVNNRIASIAADFLGSVTSLEVQDSIGKLFEFVRSPHWRNTILNSISDHGSLFGPIDD